ncbi:hypothetical protein [Streptomyces sp. NBC_01190]|uniref:hypothetical protein n=1 Tax=Streptomyces sp. NBC_01190 TaxID=2903767 RepID=UPI00386B9951|nr:hypothetical protein OG519_32030 [Streptomyces sp. NBC_01190]
MTMTPAELAALPTAPTLSSTLAEATRYVGEGPLPALSKSVYGSADPANYAAFTTPEHTVALGTALIATARRLNPALGKEWPDSSWSTGRFSATVKDARDALIAWAKDHTPAELATLFRIAAHEASRVEH